MKNDWANMQVSAQMSLDEVMLNYMDAQANATPEANPKWEPISNQLNFDQLYMSAIRDFDSSEENRSFKLGETKKWATMFFDMTGPAAFSNILELDLAISDSTDVEAPFEP